MNPIELLQTNKPLGVPILMYSSVSPRVSNLKSQKEKAYENAFVDVRNQLRIVRQDRPNKHGPGVSKIFLDCGDFFDYTGTAQQRWRRGVTENTLLDGLHAQVGVIDQFGSAFGSRQRIQKIETRIPRVGEYASRLVQRSLYRESVVDYPNASEQMKSSPATQQ